MLSEGAGFQTRESDAFALQLADDFYNDINRYFQVSTVRQNSLTANNGRQTKILQRHVNERADGQTRINIKNTFLTDNICIQQMWLKVQVSYVHCMLWLIKLHELKEVRVHTRERKTGTTQRVEFKC